MVVACRISEKLTGFTDTENLKAVLGKYGLPVEAKYDRKKAFGILKMDKKRAGKEMNYVLLKKIGSGLVKAIPMKELEKLLLNI
jgi:3-dehydroquinate synthase